MQFSDCSIIHFEFTFFLKKCKQTAEISWLFIWDVKISKNFVKHSFSIFYPYVKSYHSLCSPTTQQPRMSYQCPCFVINPIYIIHMRRLPKANFLYFVRYHPFLNFMQKNSKWIKRHFEKSWKNYKTSRKSANFSCNTDRKV